MTIEEAVKILDSGAWRDLLMPERMVEPQYNAELELNRAIKMAVAALRAQQQREQLWHDAITDPPPQPGLYYGAKDDTNSMYAVQYRDGIWTLDWYPKQKMDIVRWAFYDAFSSDDEEAEKNDPLTLEELREMDGKPVWCCNPGNALDGHWAIISTDTFYFPHDMAAYAVGVNQWFFGDYAKTWLAYSRPLESK